MLGPFGGVAPPGKEPQEAAAGGKRARRPLGGMCAMREGLSLRLLDGRDLCGDGVVQLLDVPGARDDTDAHGGRHADQPERGFGRLKECT